MQSAPPRLAIRIPAPRTPIVGRMAELENLAAMLGRSDVRLITLTGPGGVGKTRLAIEAAHHLAERGGADVVFVPLASATGPDTIVLEIARRLDFDPGQTSTIEALVKELRDTDIVLVIDNFEHVIDSAPLVARLLDGVPRLRLLVTSRAPLRLTGEHEFPLDPLPLDSDLGAFELFAQRATSVRPDFVVEPGNRSLVTEICRQLDGLPLAIELAAARLRVLSLESLHARLDRRLSVLSSGPRDAPERQQTLRNAIAWSYDLLPREQQRLFRCLSVFAGSFSLEAAEALLRSVLEPESIQRVSLDLDVMDGVFALVDQSLLRRIDTHGEDVRYLMLETIREFARDELEKSEDWHPARRAFAFYFAELVRTTNAKIKGPDAARWLRRVDQELTHIRAAIEILIDEREKALASEFVAGSSNWWAGRFSLPEMQVWVTRAMALPGELSSDQSADLEMVATWLALFQGNIETARHHIERAREAAVASGHPRHLVRYHNLLGGIAYHSSDWEAAAEEFSRAVDLAEQMEREPSLPSMLHNLGICLGILGRHDDARRALARGAEASRAAGDRLGEAGCNMRLATHAFLDGDIETATRLNRAALETYWDARQRLGISEAFAIEALIAEQRGDLDRARQLVTISEQTSAEFGIAEPDSPHVYARMILELMDRLGVPRNIGRTTPRLSITQDLIESILAEPIAPTASLVESSNETDVPGEALGLTPREVEIVRLLAQGRSNQEIADELYISLRTAQTHVSNILGKLKLNSRAAVAAVAVRHGIG